MHGGGVLAAPLPLGDPPVIRERALEALRLPQLASVLVDPERVESLCQHACERRLSRRLRPDERDPANERRIDERRHQRAIAIRVGPHERPGDGHEFTASVEHHVLGAEEPGEALVGRLARVEAVERSQERKPARVDGGVRGVLVGRSRERIRQPDHLLELRVQLRHPAEALLERHRRIPAGRSAVVDDDGDVVAVGESSVDQELVAAVQRHEFADHERASHTGSPAQASAGASSTTDALSSLRSSPDQW